MLVYGDRRRSEDPRQTLEHVSALLGRAGALSPGIARHGLLAGALIAAGELAQGLADAEFAARGADDASPVQDAAMALLLRCAAALRQSWDGGGAPLPAVPDLAGLPDRIETRLAEGFAFYALYPETYAMAAAASGLPGATRVVGLRSIGAPLAAMVATALGSAPPVTLRPVGHPFRRELAVAPGLAARLSGAAPVAVVDEGPGLSGSSFGAALDWLEGRGVPPGRIAVFPSHGNPPGAMADPRHRARWAMAERHWMPFETAVQPRLAAWAADLVGPAEGPLRDLSAAGGGPSGTPIPATGRRRIRRRSGGNSCCRPAARPGC